MIDTRYIETDALVCAMERYEDGAKEKLRQLTTRERRRLQDAMERLSNWIDEVQEGQPEDPREAARRTAKSLGLEPLNR